MHLTRDNELATLDQTRDNARATLTSLPVPGRLTAAVLYAAAPAQRLFRWYDARPAAERAPYCETWKPVLAAVWGHVSGDDDAYRTISDALGQFYLSPYSNSGDDDYPDINEDEAAATFYAANCVMHGLVDFALWAAERATDQLDFQWSGMDEHRRLAEIAAEITRQEADLALIAEYVTAHPNRSDTVPVDLVEELQRP